MLKSEFVKELTRRVKKNVEESLVETDSWYDQDFYEWLHSITDGGIEVLFYEI